MQRNHKKSSQNPVSKDTVQYQYKLNGGKKTPSWRIKLESKKKSSTKIRSKNKSDSLAVSEIETLITSKNVDIATKSPEICLRQTRNKIINKESQCNGETSVKTNINVQKLPPDKNVDNIKSTSSSSSSSSCDNKPRARRKRRVRGAILYDIERKVAAKNKYAKKVTQSSSQQKPSSLKSQKNEITTNQNELPEPDTDLPEEVTKQSQISEKLPVLTHNTIPVVNENQGQADIPCIIISDDESIVDRQIPINIISNNLAPSNKRKRNDAALETNSSKVILIDDQSDSIDLKNKECSEESDLMKHKSLKSRKKYHKEITNALSKYISIMTNESVESKVNRWIEKSFGTRLDPLEKFASPLDGDKQRLQYDSHISGMVATKMILSSPSQLMKQ